MTESLRNVPLRSVNPSWFDREPATREECVLRYLLDRAAADFPERPFMRNENGVAWSYADARRIARMTADALSRLGVGRGDLVLVWLPNGLPFMRAFMGINYLGAVLVPINTAYRGKLLAHVLRNTAARVMIAHTDLVDRLDGIDTAALETVIVNGDIRNAPQAAKCLPFAALDGDAEAFDDALPVEPWDLHAVLYTSGTTGPSKGVMQSYQQIATYAAASKGYMRADDHMFINLPMFHVAGTLSFYGTLRAGASLTIADGFSAGTFWRQVRESSATCMPVLMGAMIWFLMKNETSEADIPRRIRMTCLNPANRETMAFARQLGFGWFASYSMTELSCPLIAEMDSAVENSCGRARTGVECRLVDEHDMEVPPGAAGELVLRTDRPWALTSGYLNNPEATARAWRNGWFHTGDLMRRDADGNYFFIDRLKDALRRRGENVSSVEVEEEALAHPAVLEAAAVAVSSAQGEDDILLCLAPRPGASIDPVELIGFMSRRMAYFMVPRYLRLMDSLPKTESGKVRKVALREEGLNAQVWDREAAGIVLKRDRLAQY